MSFLDRLFVSMAHELTAELVRFVREIESGEHAVVEGIVEDIAPGEAVGRAPFSGEPAVVWQAEVSQLTGWQGVPLSTALRIATHRPSFELVLVECFIVPFWVRDDEGGRVLVDTDRSRRSVQTHVAFRSMNEHPRVNAPDAELTAYLLRHGLSPDPFMGTTGHLAFREMAVGAGDRVRIAGISQGPALARHDMGGGYRDCHVPAIRLLGTSEAPIGIVGLDGT